MSPTTDTARERDRVIERTIAGEAWRETVVESLREGWRFAGLWASAETAGRVVRAAFLRGTDFLLLSSRAMEGALDSIVGLVQAADWDEREAHDLYGVAFPGHPWPVPLVDHPRDLGAWTVPVTGHDTFQVAVGPIHAGIIESGHFRFHVVGERILHLDLRLFYKHRGLERAAEGRSPADAVRYAQRACAADAVANATAFAQACESARGLWPDPALRRARTLLLELERLYNHLNDISAICAGVGFAPGTMLFAGLKERAQRLNQRLTGHRFLFDRISVGDSSLQIGSADGHEARAELRDLRRDAERGWRSLLFSTSAQERFEGVGRLTRDEAERHGTVGPVARAAGIEDDARLRSPRLWYASFSPAAPQTPSGDVAARLQMRAAELAFTFDCLDELLARRIASGRATPDREPAEHGLAVVESPRGQTLCAVELDEQTVARVHLRTASRANWPALSTAVHQELLPDFPLINKSFELCYACVDR